jgi:hypothetical protein
MQEIWFWNFDLTLLMKYSSIPYGEINVHSVKHEFIENWLGSLSSQHGWYRWKIVERCPKLM